MRQFESLGKQTPRRQMGERFIQELPVRDRGKEQGETGSPQVRMLFWHLGKERGKEGRKERGLVRRSLRLQGSFEKVLVRLMWVRVPHGMEISQLSDPHHEYSHCSGALGESRVSAWTLWQIHGRCNTCGLPGDYPHCSREIRVVCLRAVSPSHSDWFHSPGSPVWVEVCDVLGPLRHMEKCTVAHVGKIFFPFPLSGRYL